MLEEKLYSCHTKAEAARCFKEHIKSYVQGLEAEFPEHQGRSFYHHHTRFYDGILGQLYKWVIRAHFGDYLPMLNQIPLTLVALGSYGRDELCVYSDIDLMVVYKEIPAYHTKLLAEQILYMGWDCGLKLGHRVHEVSELPEAAKSDSTIKTALLESRYLCGSRYLFTEIQNRLQQIRRHDPKGYLLEKLNEYQQRLARYPLQMEPDLKEGRGGLRDAHLLFWILKVLYDAPSIKQAQTQMGFSDLEYREFKVALELLFRVRAALHLCAGKKQDRLALERIPGVMQRLGLQGAQIPSGQRQFAARVFSAMDRVHRFCERYVMQSCRGFGFESAHLSRLRKARLEGGIYLLEGRAYVPFFAPPIKLSELLARLEGLPDLPFYSDARLVCWCERTLVLSAPTRANIRAFYGLFRRTHTYGILWLLLESGILEVLLPLFRRVRHMPQFDGYHHYPVDYHSIQTVKTLEQISDPFVLGLWERLEGKRKAMLKLVALLHDVGKGRVREHALVGEALFKKVALRMGMEQELVSEGALLIRHHVLMSDTARREDIYSQKVLLEFILTIKTPELLGMLLILTTADIAAVGPGVLGPFMEKLLQELYHNALAMHERRGLLHDAERRIKKEAMLRRSEEFKPLPAPLKKQILSIESDLMFEKLSPSEIVAIALRVGKVQEYDFSLGNEEFFTLELWRKIPLNLGYLLGRLAYLNIAAMDVFRLFGGCKYFRFTFHEKALEEDVQQIPRLVRDSFDMQKRIRLAHPEINRREIRLEIDHSPALAALRLNAKDQKGLLAYVMSVFDELEIEMVGAKVHTHQNRARDLFLIEKNENFWNNKEQIIASILR